MTNKIIIGINYAPREVYALERRLIEYAREGKESGQKTFAYGFPKLMINRGSGEAGFRENVGDEYMYNFVKGLERLGVRTHLMEDPTTLDVIRGLQMAQNAIVNGAVDPERLARIEGLMNGSRKEAQAFEGRFKKKSGILQLINSDCTKYSVALRALKESPADIPERIEKFQQDREAHYVNFLGASNPGLVVIDRLFVEKLTQELEAIGCEIASL